LIQINSERLMGVLLFNRSPSASSLRTTAILDADPLLCIGLSVVVLGIAVAFGFHIPTAATMGLVGFFAIFHGHAHGAEMPESASGFEYGAGFVLATAMLHACGIGTGLLIGRMRESYGNRILQAAGSAMVLAGVAILTGYM
jgi:urease accessory protein